VTRTEALLISPYFVPGVAGAELLAARAREGVSLRVLTNSLAATDIALVHAGYSRYREDLLAAGVQIHELKPHQVRRIGILGRSKASLHTKALVVDGQRFRRVVQSGSALSS
jgi:putative cardiolipin synthase